MERYFCLGLSLLCLLAGTSAPLIGEESHPYPFTGTWKLNLQKSTFNPGPAPRDNVVTIGGDGTVSFHGLDADGKPTGRSHPLSVNREVPFDGTKTLTIITSVVGNVVDDTIKSDGKPVQTVHVVFSQNGATITAKRTGKDPQGRSFENLEIYERQ